MLRREAVGALRYILGSLRRQNWEVLGRCGLHLEARNIPGELHERYASLVHEAPPFPGLVDDSFQITAGY